MLTADVLRPADIAEAVAGRDAIISALGPSGLGWTLLRPPQLTGKPLTGRYRTRQGVNPRRGLRVSRADLAHLALAVADGPDTYLTVIFLAD